MKRGAGTGSRFRARQQRRHSKLACLLAGLVEGGVGEEVVKVVGGKGEVGGKVLRLRRKRGRGELGRRRRGIGRLWM